MTHRLDPLLRPRSIAVVGASEREESVGRVTVHNLLAGGFDGTIYPVNPGRNHVLGLPCHATLDDLPERVDHVVFCVGDRHLEGALNAAIEHGARAGTIMSQLIVPGDPGLADRVRRTVHDAGFLVCGPNGMGFYNARDGVWVCGFDTRENHVRGGNVTLVSQSGAGMSGIVDCEERIDFNLAVSTGSEFTVDLADYLDFAIRVHEPSAIGLFMETARRPRALLDAFALARERGIPIVALKVGRTAFSARLAQSHSGAVAGEDAAFQAVFDRYGVQRVDDMHELVATLMLFAQPASIPQRGGLVTLHDSGGERQLLVDLANEVGAPLAQLGPDTVQNLESRLDPGLPAVNPLDAWGAGGPDADDIMADCLASMMSDPDASIGAVVHDRAPHSGIYVSYLDYLRHARESAGKPLALVSNHQGSGSDPLAIEATREGFPVIDGLRPFLVATRSLLAWRDARLRPETAPVAMPSDARNRFLDSLGSEPSPGEFEALSALEAAGFPCAPGRIAQSPGEALEAAMAIDGAVVLKTAERGQAHKSDEGGVHLDLTHEDAVREAYDDLSRRLGPRVLVAPMARPGIELVLGMVRDPQFGPLVLLGFGGIAMEALDDTVCALPPFDAAEARRLVDRLAHRPLLDLARGHGPADVDAFVELAARFSALVSGLDEDIAEIDLNPVIVHRNGCTVVDALIIPSDTASVSIAPSRKVS